MIKKKSSILHTRKHKQKYSNNNNNDNNHNSQTIKNSKINIDINNNNSDKYSIVSINSKFSKDKTKKRKKYKTFLSHVHTIRRIKRILPKNEDTLAKYLDDYRRDFKNGKILKGSILDSHFFNNKTENCVCENIYKILLDKNCKCNNIKIDTDTFKNKNNETSYSLKCSKIKNTLKVLPLNYYYVKMRIETHKYMFIEFDKFTLQTIINNYVNKSLPYNSVNIINSGICNKNDYKDKLSKDTIIKDNYHGYNLMTNYESNLGNGKDFLLNIINGTFDNELHITNEIIRYSAVMNFLLQSILIIAHLQTSFNFYHGAYIPENIIVKRMKTDKLKYFKFNAFGNIINIKNMGFAILISNFDKSSITINSELLNIPNTKYRLTSSSSQTLLYKYAVNSLIKEFGDTNIDSNVDSSMYKKYIKKLSQLDKSNLINVLSDSGLKLFIDFDIYIFIITLLNDINIKEYILKNKLDYILFSFMSPIFKQNILNFLSTYESLNDKVLIDISYMIVNILYKTNEPINKIFTNDYFKLLKNLNYKLFKI
jgi:hypothetical protein